MPPGSPFTARPIPYPQIVAPFTLAPGQDTSVVLAYSSQGSSRVTMSIETAESFARQAMTAAAKNYTFYGMILVLIAVTSIAVVAPRQMLFAVYDAYIFSLAF